MAIQIGQLVRDIVAKITRPEPDTVQLIDGGPNAPHLAQRPSDYREGDLAPGPWHLQVKLDGIRCLYIDGRLVSTIHSKCSSNSKM